MHLAQIFNRHGFRVRAGNFVMALQGFDHLNANGQNRVQSHHGILKYHTDSVSPDAPQDGFIGFCQILAVKKNAPARDMSRLADQIQNGKSGNGFSRARLADESQTFAPMQIKRNLVHSGQGVVPQRESHFQFLDA